MNDWREYDDLTKFGCQRIWMSPKVKDDRIVLEGLKNYKLEVSSNFLSSYCCLIPLNYPTILIRLE